MSLASHFAIHGGVVSPFWLVGTLFLLTIGELCLSNWLINHDQTCT